MQQLESAVSRTAQPPFARGIRGATAAALSLAGPAVSAAGVLTTGLSGTAPAVRFPPGYRVSLAVTVAITIVASALAALIARRDALVVIPLALGIWVIVGAGVTAAGAWLGHPALTEWGLLLLAASLIGAAAGMLMAARCGRAGQSSPRDNRA